LETEITKDLYRRLTYLTDQPVLRIPQEEMESYLQHFEKYCAGSKRMTETAKKIIPGGVQHNLAFNYP